MTLNNDRASGEFSFRSVGDLPASSSSAAVAKPEESKYAAWEVVFQQQHLIVSALFSKMWYAYACTIDLSAPSWGDACAIYVLRFRAAGSILGEDAVVLATIMGTGL